MRAVAKGLGLGAVASGPRPALFKQIGNIRPMESVIH